MTPLLLWAAYLVGYGEVVGFAGSYAPLAALLPVAVSGWCWGPVGGLASVWGAPFGAAAVTLLTVLLREVLPRFVPNASGEHTIIAYGIILVAIMIFMPEGLTRGLLHSTRRHSLH